jgi:hypothetical protein
LHRTSCKIPTCRSPESQDRSPYESFTTFTFRDGTSRSCGYWVRIWILFHHPLLNECLSMEDFDNMVKFYAFISSTKWLDLKSSLVIFCGSSLMNSHRGLEHTRYLQLACKRCQSSDPATLPPCHPSTMLSSLRVLFITIGLVHKMFTPLLKFFKDTKWELWLWAFSLLTLTTCSRMKLTCRGFERSKIPYFSRSKNFLRMFFSGRNLLQPLDQPF